MAKYIVGYKRLFAQFERMDDDIKTPGVHKYP